MEMGDFLNIKIMVSRKRYITNGIPKKYPLNPSFVTAAMMQE